MCFNFIQVSVKKLNLNSLKFSVSLYLSNIQKEVFIVCNEICNEVMMMIIQYQKIITDNWVKTKYARKFVG